MVQLFHTILVSIDLAKYDMFRAEVCDFGKGSKTCSLTPLFVFFFFFHLNILYKGK